MWVIKMGTCWKCDEMWIVGILPINKDNLELWMWGEVTVLCFRIGGVRNEFLVGTEWFLDFIES